MNKVSIITLGCKQNKYESDCMAGILKRNGYEVVEGLEYADVYIINTCAVTAEAEKKSRQYIKKCITLNNDAKVIICGCASENNIEQFKCKPNIYSAFGTEGKQNILKYLNNSIVNRETLETKYSSPNSPEKTTTREYIKIQDGCNNFCSYCLIPYLRGRSRSRDLDEIILEAKTIAERSREIVLTGIDISSYKINDKPALPLLMERLGSIGAIISLGSLEVSVITEQLLVVLKQMPNFSPHFHLSLQSGNDEILKLMNRHYTCQDFFDKIQLIRKYFPLANITTDVIVGFGGETEEQFESTKKFIIKCGFSFVHIFPYSKRLGTRAYNFPDIPSSIKKSRVDALEEVNVKLKNDYLSKFIGKKSIMLAEEKKTHWEGFSTEYIRCYCENNLHSGKLYEVEFKEILNNGMKVNFIREIE